MSMNDRIRHFWIADRTLALLRKKIGSSYERYTKYYMVGAWAGAALVTGDGAVEVYFDSKTTIDRSSEWEFYFAYEGVRIGVFGDPAMVRRIAQHVPRALEEAHQAWTPTNSESVRVASIHVSLLINSDSADADPRALLQDVCGSLGTTLGLPWISSPGERSVFGDDRVEGDATFLLPQPTPEPTVVEQVRKAFPDVPSELVGWGALPIKTVDNRISWCHLYVRQAY